MYVARLVCYLKYAGAEKVTAGHCEEAVTAQCQVRARYLTCDNKMTSA